MNSFGQISNKILYGIALMQNFENLNLNKVMIFEIIKQY